MIHHQPPFQILLLEDNPSDVYLLRLALNTTELDFEIFLLADGAAAVSYLSQEENSTGPLPDLAVLDLNVPKLDGLQVLEILRRNKRFSRLPVVVTTSSSTLSERTRAEQLGVDRFFTKPHDLAGFCQFGCTLKTMLLDLRSQIEPDL